MDVHRRPVPLFVSIRADLLPFARNKEVCLGRSAAASGPCCARPEDRLRDTLQTPLLRLRGINARKSAHRTSV